MWAAALPYDVRLKVLDVVFPSQYGYGVHFCPPVLDQQAELKRKLEQAVGQYPEGAK